MNKSGGEKSKVETEFGGVTTTHDLNIVTPAEAPSSHWAL